MSINYEQKIGRATVWSSVTEIVTKLISPLVNMVLARLLVPEAFGVVATITMVISFAEIFTDAGFQKYIVQHEFQSTDDLDKSTNVAFWTNLSVSVFICLIIFIFRHNIADLVGNPGLGNSISIASVLIIIAAFSSIQMARYKRDFNFKTLFFVRIGSAFIPVLVTIPLSIVLRNYWALLIGTFVSHLFNAVVLTLKSKWRPSFYYNFNLFKNMFSFSAWTLLESISIWLTSYIGVFIVGNYLNDYYLGLYKTTMSTINSYMAIITSAITPVLFSALSRYQNDDRLFKESYYNFQRITAIFVFPMGIGIYIFRDLVTKILLGSQWMEASDFIGLWGLTSSITIVFSHFASEVYRSKGNPKISMLTQIIHLIFLVPTLVISVKHGFEALYVARSLIRFQIIIVALIILHVLYKIKITDIFKNVYPTIIASFIMGLIGYVLKLISPNIIWNFCIIFICVLVYFFSLFIISPKLWSDLQRNEVINNLLKKVANKRISK